MGLKKDLKGVTYLQYMSAVYRVGDYVIATIEEKDCRAHIERLQTDDTVLLTNGAVVGIDKLRHNPFGRPPLR